MIAACSNDDSMLSPSDGYTISVPVELYTGQVPVTRTIGDPGLDDNMLAPEYVYAWACINTNALNGVAQYEVSFAQAIVSNWQLRRGAVDSENEETHYACNLNFKFYNEVNGGRIYAIASARALSHNELYSIYAGITEDNYAANNRNVLVNNNPQSILQNALINCGDWTSAELGSLYSTPKGEAGYDNGIISLSGVNVNVTPVKLYHAAAKYDFTWEVPTLMQSTVSVSGITATGLPTKCKIFEPTDNPSENTAEVKVFGDASPNTVNDGNKWLGRAYVYGLQARNAHLPYTVTFTGAKLPVSASFDATNNTIYTAWYRVVATVR